MSNEHSSYEISKRLHDKGFRAEYESVWFMGKENRHLASKVMDDGRYKECFPAYTFTELWGAMPRGISHRNFTARFEIFKNADGGMSIQYSSISPYIKHNSPAECAAMMVEWLIDNGHTIKSEVE